MRRLVNILFVLISLIGFVVAAREKYQNDQLEILAECSEATGQVLRKYILPPGNYQHPDGQKEHVGERYCLVIALPNHPEIHERLLILPSWEWKSFVEGQTIPVTYFQGAAGSLALGSKAELQAASGGIKFPKGIGYLLFFVGLAGATKTRPRGSRRPGLPGRRL